MNRLSACQRAAWIAGTALLCLTVAARPRPSGSHAPVAPPTPAAQDQGGKASDLASALYIEPADLSKALAEAKGNKPLVIHVGFRNLYTQAYIPGAEYQGPGSKPEGLELLRKRVASLPKNKYIVIYCGCCPWTHCPNMKPAYDALHALGFTNIKVLHIDNNFKTDWVDKGYTVSKSVEQ